MFDFKYKLADGFATERLYFDKYNGLIPEISESYPDYFGSKMEIKRDQNGGFITVASWTNFIPTIIPIADYVLLIIFKFESLEVVKEKYVYAIEQKKLLELLAGQFKIKQEPVEYIVLDYLEPEKQEMILESASLLWTEN